GVEDEQLSAWRLEFGVWNAHDDSVVARDRRSVDTESLLHARADGESPWRVHLHAVRGMEDDPPVSEFVAGALDDEHLVARDVSRRGALLGQVGDEVGGGARIEASPGEPVGGIR